MLSRVIKWSECVCTVVCVYACWTGSTTTVTSVSHSTSSASVSLTSWWVVSTLQFTQLSNLTCFTSSQHTEDVNSYTWKSGKNYKSNNKSCCGIILFFWVKMIQVIQIIIQRKLIFKIFIILCVLKVKERIFLVKISTALDKRCCCSNVGLRVLRQRSLHRVRKKNEPIVFYA